VPPWPPGKSLLLLAAISSDGDGYDRLCGLPRIGGLLLAGVLVDFRSGFGAFLVLGAS
jgi:hypothetical protein